MPYLTYDEFKDFSQSEIYEPTFNKLIKKASAILNNITGYFYIKNNITKDNHWLIDQFKQALCAQIEYFHEVGSTTFEGINQAPQSIQAGKKSGINTRRSKAGGEN